MGVFTMFLFGACGALVGVLIVALCMVTGNEDRLRELIEDDHVFIFPVIPNDFIYEIVEDERFEPCVVKYKVSDVSVKGVEFDGMWVSWKNPNIFMTRNDAERELRKRMKMLLK